MSEQEQQGAGASRQFSTFTASLERKNALLERQTAALESIAASLAKMANPMMKTNPMMAVPRYSDPGPCKFDFKEFHHGCKLEPQRTFTREESAPFAGKLEAELMVNGVPASQSPCTIPLGVALPLPHGWQVIDCGTNQDGDFLVVGKPPTPTDGIPVKAGDVVRVHPDGTKEIALAGDTPGGQFIPVRFTPPHLTPEAFADVMERPGKFYHSAINGRTAMGPFDTRADAVADAVLHHRVLFKTERVDGMGAPSEAETHDFREEPNA